MNLLLALPLMVPSVASAARAPAPLVVTGYTHSRALPLAKYKPKRLRVFGKRLRVTVCPDPATIRRVIRRHRVRIRRCYKKHALARDPKRAGRVVMGFTIGVAGKVRAVRVRRSGLADKPTERCLAKVPRSLTDPLS